MEATKIVVIGSSFSSACVFSSLEKYLTKVRTPIDLTLISNSNYFYSSDLLFPFLANSCFINDVCQDYRDFIFVRPGVSFLKADVVDIDFKKNLIKTSILEIPYHYLVLAPEADLLDIEEVFPDEEYFIVNNPCNVVELKKHIAKSLELSVNESDFEKKQKLLTFCVAGSTLRSIQHAMAIQSFAYDLIKSFFPEINKQQLKFFLIEQESALQIDSDLIYKNRLIYYLKTKNINVSLSSKIIKMENGVININGQKEIKTATMVFTEGNYVSRLTKKLKLPKDSCSNLLVDLYLKPQDLENVFCAGKFVKCLDLSEDINRNDIYFLNQARICAKNIISKINNNKLMPSSINNVICFSLIDKRNSIVENKGIYIDGFIGWLIFRLVYAMIGLGLKRKFNMFLRVLLDVVRLRRFYLFDLFLINEKDLISKDKQRSRKQEAKKQEAEI